MTEDAPVLELHGRAMRHSVVVVSLIGDDQWDAPTPCADWTIRDLLTHMTTENRGFAAAALGETTSRDAWTDRPFSDDPRRDYAMSADEVVTAFADPAPEFWLPNINETFRFPATQAIGFHLLDYVVHTWDVAASLGRTVALEDDLVAAAQEIADRDVPDGERRRRPGAGFQPPVKVSGEATPLAHLLAFLGRDTSPPPRI
ncbi:MAG: TIGR03086 family metal-binding protein [Actinophytocola sp.]|uniref:TIGR03086 family metal-binding protein n=1 Tax=Actinophytocola sp. TaxID=1872138 RepID=UPI003C77837C